MSPRVQPAADEVEMGREVGNRIQKDRGSRSWEQNRKGSRVEKLGKELKRIEVLLT